MDNKQFRAANKKVMASVSKSIDKDWDALCRVAEACQKTGKNILVNTPYGDFTFMPTTYFAYTTSYKSKK